MKKIYFKTELLEDTFNEAKDFFEGKLTTQNNEYYLKMNSNLANGIIEGISFTDGLTYMYCKIRCNQDVMLLLESLNKGSLLLVYTMNGTLQYQFGTSGDKKCLQSQHTAILRNVSSGNPILYVPKGEKVKFALICIGEKFYNDNQISFLAPKLQHFFFQRTKQSILIKFQNFRISEKLKQLRSRFQNDIARHLLKKALLQFIIASEIEQHTTSFAPIVQLPTCLTTSQIEEIKKITRFIKKFPEEQFTIRFLTKKTGLSPNKLQEGFKILYNMTVNDFITCTRIEKAEYLIRTSELNISEIVYSIGFSSRSYFSKIFKEKYNCSPRDYHRYKNRVAVTA